MHHNKLFISQDSYITSYIRGKLKNLNSYKFPIFLSIKTQHPQTQYYL